MDNARLVQLEVALERERQTMKRQELLRQIWIVNRSIQHESSVFGELTTSSARQREKLETQTQSTLPTQGKSALPAQTASTAV
jgi:hypothetical protein